MDFNQLEYVMAVAEEKSFSKAAEKLYISQPSLSQYIMRLEEHLGIKLFDRTTNPISLTFAGEKYIEAAKNILSLKKQLEREIDDITDSKKGRIVIGIPMSIERYILPMVLPEFYKRFPQYEIVIESSNAAGLEEMLINGRVDIAILHLPIQNKHIVYEHISDENIFLVVPPIYNIQSIMKMRDNKRLDFNCLQNEKFILLKQGQRMRFIADELFKHAQFKPDIAIETKNLDTAYCLATAGVGFTLVPESVIRILSKNNYQNYLLVNDLVFTLVFAYRKGEYLTKAVREFIGITKETMALKRESALPYDKNYYKIFL